MVAVLVHAIIATKQLFTSAFPETNTYVYVEIIIANWTATRHDKTIGRFSDKIDPKLRQAGKWWQVCRLQM